MSKTKPSARLTVFGEKREIPKRVPINAPSNTATKKVGS